MDFWNLAIRIIGLSQTTIGILGNFSLTFYYLILYYKKCTLKPTDLILTHMMAANALNILSAGVPHTLTVWGLNQFLNDLGCKLLLYIQRVGRSVSIGTVCLLSVSQAMTINPGRSWWKDHKDKAAKYVCCSVSLLWVLYILIHFIFLVYTITQKNSRNVTRKRDFGYCATLGTDEVNDALYVALVVCPEVFFSVLIVWASGSMIVVLYGHKQRVQHIRSSHSSSRTSPESRATQNILVLVSTFLGFYTLSSILQGCLALSYNHDGWLLSVTCLTSLCFPCFGPFVLMNHYAAMPMLRLVCVKSKNLFILTQEGK